MGTPSEFGMRYPESSGSCTSMIKFYHGVRNYWIQIKNSKILKL